MRWYIGGKAHEKGGETEGVFGGDTELRLTCSEKDEMGMSEDSCPKACLSKTTDTKPGPGQKRGAGSVP